MTADAKEQADAAQRKLKGFRHLSSYGVCELLGAANLLPGLDEGPSLKADPTLVITEHGLALAARELDSQMRRAFRVVVWTKSGNVSTALVKLVESHLADGLPVVTPRDSEIVAVPINAPVPSPVIEVQGSSSDFEYQLPAAPAFFVGRKTVAADLTKRILGRGAAGVIVINAKSGWGKSSLSLRLQKDVERAGGVALVVDTRTAERPDFAAVALERAVRRAVERGTVSLPASAAFSSVQSIVETLRTADWRGRRPILVIFDQFENVFRSMELTKEFRDLAFLVKDLDVPLTVGFSWKTDIVGWTEAHPYRLRDEIREAAHVAVLEPFGPREVDTLLRRLEKLSATDSIASCGSGFASIHKGCHGCSRSLPDTSLQRSTAA